MHTDIPDHAQLLSDYVLGKAPLPSNSLFYVCVYILTFFSSDIGVILTVSAYVLAFAGFLKYYIVKQIFLHELKVSEVFVSISSFLLLMTFSLPIIHYVFGTFYYLGNYPPNVWHNSTLTVAMPFVLLLFWLTVKQCVAFSQKRLFIILVLILLNVLAKPSFVLTYIVALPLFLFLKFGFRRSFWLGMIPVVFSIICIGVQYVIQYDSNNTTGDSIQIIPFEFIDTWFAHGNGYLRGVVLFSAIVAGFLFPIVVLLKNRGLFKVVSVQFAVLCTVVGIVIAQLVAEVGSRAGHGNFVWQTLMCAFIMFFVCANELLKFVFNEKKSWKRFLPEFVAFFLHVASLIYYFISIYKVDHYG